MLNDYGRLYVSAALAGNFDYSQFNTGVAVSTCRSTAFMNMDPAPSVYPFER